MRETKLLIIGAGPFGLALAAQAQAGIQHLVVGKPMEFWRQNMPKGMYLRSACDWHLDPLNIHTIEAFLKPQRKTANEVEPLSLDFYLSYVDWFQQQKKIQSLPVYIRQLDRDVSNKGFVATTERGQAIKAKNVVLAPGFKHFKQVPDDLKKRLPPGRFQHTADFVDFNMAANRR
ncbi:MAG TPA: hypothetical protein VJS64_09000, partial [Pyrinomonadaceae bacterium]|nr:hypothetical protein [Pyrinomonadaceae bacterium]